MKTPRLLNLGVCVAVVSDRAGPDDCEAFRSLYIEAREFPQLYQRILSKQLRRLSVRY